MVIWMKAIQITFDEEMLEQLDARPEVRERGRSAVLREVTAAYLAEKRAEDIAREYREGYTKYPQTDEDLAWAGVQAWPAKADDDSVDFLSRRVFLDTNIVQTLQSQWFREYFFDGYWSPEAEKQIEHRGSRFSEDIHALAAWMDLTRRGGWPIAVSRQTFEELRAHPDMGRRSRLLRWVSELNEYSAWSAAHYAGPAYADSAFAFLPDPGDAVLIREAIELGCATFLTMDYKTIHRFRDRILEAGIEVLRPVEFMERLKPWIGLLR